MCAGLDDDTAYQSSLGDVFAVADDTEVCVALFSLHTIVLRTLRHNCPCCDCLVEVMLASIWLSTNLAF